MTAQLLGSKICSVMLLDDKGEQLKIAATQSLSDSYRNMERIGMRLMFMRAVWTPLAEPD